MINLMIKKGYFLFHFLDEVDIFTDKRIEQIALILSRYVVKFLPANWDLAVYENIAALISQYSFNSDIDESNPINYNSQMLI